MTFVSFPDFVAYSPDRRLRLEVTGTQDGEPFRQQSGFVYSMFKTRGARGSDSHGEPDPLADRTQPAWQWSAGNRGLSDHPHEAWISNDGWVVVRQHTWGTAGLLVLSPQGEFKVSRRMTRDEPADEPGFLEGDESYISRTTAGPFWAGNSLARFYRFQGRPFWSVRTWWGRRVIIDLAMGKIVDQPSSVHAGVIRELEVAWVLRTLERGTPVVEALRWDSPREARVAAYPVYTAAYHAGTLGLRAAEPFLRRLESARVLGYTTGQDDLEIAGLGLRLVAKMSLLRLGFEPRWIPNLLWTINAREGLWDRDLAEIDVPPRPRSPDMFRVGENQRSLLERAGAPEFLRQDWHYAFLTPEGPQTVRLQWTPRYGRKDGQFVELNQESTVAQIETIPLPPWQADPMLEYEYASR